MDIMVKMAWFQIIQNVLNMKFTLNSLFFRKFIQNAFTKLIVTRFDLKLKNCLL